jgi:hypothetical protein
MPATVGILMFEAALFALASLTHGGLLLQGHEHARAAIAEAVIAAVLGLGFIACLARPGICRRASIGLQVFAIVGVLVGLVMIAIGVGPNTTFDLALHAVMLVTLVTGLLLALRSR